MTGYLIGHVGEAPDFYFNGSIQECIIAFAFYGFGYSEVFKRACLAMDTVEQCLELYDSFYNASINLVIAVDQTQLQYITSIEKVNSKELIDSYSK